MEEETYRKQNKGQPGYPFFVLSPFSMLLQPVDVAVRGAGGCKVVLVVATCRVMLQRGGW